MHCVNGRCKPLIPGSTQSSQLCDLRREFIRLQLIDSTFANSSGRQFWWKRYVTLKPLFYDRLLDHFHSAAVKPDALAALWARLVLKLFPAPVRVNGRLVLVGDGIKAAKRGKKMPGVKLLHQQSDSNKAEYIMGHSCRRSVFWYRPLRRCSRCRPPCASTRASCGPTAISAPCSTRCSRCSASSVSPKPSTSWAMPTMPVARSSKAYSRRIITS